MGTTSRYHLTEEGPKPCHAKEGNCPKQGLPGHEGAHYSSLQEAQESYESIMASQHQLTGQRRHALTDLSTEAFTQALAEAPVYRKQAKVTMRVAKEGEVLEIRLANGSLETTQVLTGGECVVKNPGGEEYAIAVEKFHKLYSPEGDHWRAKGRIRAVPNPTGKPLTIMAPWGEEQRGDEGCFIAVSVTNPDDRYLIGRDEFAQTYKRDKSLPSTVVTATITPQAGGRYYGCSVPKESVLPYREELHNILGQEAEAFEQAKAARDRGYHYHLTTVGPPEMKRVKGSLTAPPSTVSLHYKGLGRAVEGEEEAYFIVCTSPEVDAWRGENGLPPKDLHITLGFRGKDVHSQPKGSSSLIAT